MNTNEPDIYDAVAELRAKHVETLLNNWPLRDVLVALTHAATHLLIGHACNVRNHEELQHAVTAAQCYADLMESRHATAAAVKRGNWSG